MHVNITSARARLRAALFAAALAPAPGVFGYGDANPYPYAVHPGFTVQALNLPAKYSTMGLAWLANGDMVMANCQTDGNYGGGSIPGPNSESGVYIVHDPSGNPSVRQIASMFRQPSGVVVVHDTIYVSDRDGFYRIKSLNPADPSKNRALAMLWPRESTPANFSNGDWNQGYWHQWVFTPAWYNGKFYAPYSGTIVIGGPSDNPPSTSYSGAFLSWGLDSSGGLQKIAGGFRQPNGMGVGPDGMMLVSDNQGSWEPSCPLNLIRPGRFYGHRQDSAYAPNWAQAAYKNGTMPYDPPVAWMLDGDAPAGGGPGQSTSQPLYMDRGPYAGDWIVGDDNSKGLSRVTLDPVDGGSGNSAKYNGSVTFFTDGFGDLGQEAAPNRLAWDPSKEIVYVGTLGFLGNWPTSTAQPFFAIRFDDAAAAATFEIKAVRSRLNGVEIEFTQPINPSTALARNFLLNHFQINRQDGYGAGNDQIQTPSIAAVQVSDDARRVFLQVGNIAKIDRVLKITAPGIRSATGDKLFFNQAYFTHNYQSTQAFVAKATGVGPAQAGGFLENHVTSRLLGGSLLVEVDLAGAYTVSLREVNGALAEKREGRGPAQFEFSRGRGLCVLQVSQGGRDYFRPVFR